MTPKSIEEAFQRHPRPQVPTKAAISQRLTVPTKGALLQRAKEDEKRRALLQTVNESPWTMLTRHGELLQGKSVRSICVSQGKLVMIKEIASIAGRRQLEMSKKLSEHSHVSTIQKAFEAENLIYVQLEYSKYTLEEILNVHICLEEAHIRVIASAVKYLSIILSNLRWLKVADISCNTAYS